ncbi:MAG: dienelactone hydrolase family protein [Armatimonadetes bacterium]|nr:dienelactone hydrolase family protein [Armatimonadota bacterium]
MNGETVHFDGNGQTYSGYLSRSAAGTGPGVIVIQEWWGLVGHVRDVADRFAEAGFTALAPDFYHGKTTAEPDEAGSLMMALEIDEAARVIRGAVDRLLEDDGTTGHKVGVVGFCMGGQLSMFAACIDERIGACVNFYGIHPSVSPDFSRLQSPLLGFFAEHDDYASPAAVAGLQRELEEKGRVFEFKTFPDTHHAFFNSDRPEVYNPQAAGEAWQETLKFFRTHLKES